MLRAKHHFRDNQQRSSAKFAEDNRRKWYIAARNQREKKEQLEERAEEELMGLVSAAIIATEIEVQAFQAKLDIYDEATVKALMENTQALEAVAKRIQNKLEHAHTLEDGRKVFKSQDGTWAIDEDGKELDASTNDMEAIPQTKVTAEEYKIDIEERNKLNIERQDILDYQDKLDHARERSNSGDFTKDELDELEAELESDMPMAVKRQFPDYEVAKEVDLKSSFDTSEEISPSELPKQVAKPTFALGMQ